MGVELEDRITIGTPEGIELQLQLAGAASRYIARGIDLALQLMLIALLFILTLVIGGGAGGGVIGFIGGWAAAGFFVSVFAVFYFYNVLFEVLAQGRTPGKRATHLRVVREQGTPVDLPASLVRNLLRLIDELLFGLPALVAILLTKHNQRLGDLAAGTLVIREAPTPDIRSDSLLQTAGQTAAGQAIETSGWDLSAVSAEELAAIRRFLERRGTFERHARQELARRLEQGLRAKVAGAPPTHDPELFLEALAQAKASR
jgi:uncharacterized RDD family membrane protein YckC